MDEIIEQSASEKHTTPLESLDNITKQIYELAEIIVGEE